MDDDENRKPEFVPTAAGLRRFGIVPGAADADASFRKLRNVRNADDHQSSDLADVHFIGHVDEHDRIFWGTASGMPGRK